MIITEEVPSERLSDPPSHKATAGRLCEQAKSGKNIYRLAIKPNPSLRPNPNPELAVAVIARSNAVGVTTRQSRII